VTERVADRSHLSIGEVLSLLKEEFPDVTISKIRFLESQGLLDPERTPSGYRKFYDADVERLRWILRQQRENFLPLKVIRGRLGPEEPAAASEPPPAPVRSEGRPPARDPAARADPPPPPSTPPPAPRPASTTVSRRRAPSSETSLTLEELAAASDLALSQVKDLEKFGLVAGKTVAGSVYYDADALEVCEIAAGFLRFGVEARHLRMYKNASDREVGFFEQVVTPLLKQRNPRSKKQAMDTLDEMSALGEGLRAALVRQALRDFTGT
jgi:DNA-binding transcriptional MerR regulator